MEDKLYGIIVDILEIDKMCLSKETKIEDIPEWDSLAHIRIIAEIEEELNIQIPLNKVMDIATIADLIGYII